MGYPNEFDRSLGRTGSELMVHGACSSRGCYSMTDESIQEIYTLGRLAFQGGQRDFQVQAFPFRMTAENMARHRNDPNLPFWLMLKEGYDSFELLGQPPKIDVCDQRYIFNSTPADGMTFSASAQCPPMSMPETIRTALGAKQARDNERMLEIAARLDQREGQSGAAAIRLALAEPSSVERSMPLMMSVATAPVSLEPTTTAVEPAMTASVSAQPSGTDTVTLQPMSPPVAAVASAPAQVPAPLPPVAVAAAPIPPAEPDPIAAAIDAGFLAVPDLRSGEVEVPPQPAAAPAQPAPGSDVATLEERMLAGSTPADASVANSYASASEEDGLTGMVLKLIKKQQQDGAAPN
jgi:hypothetical protein